MKREFKKKKLLKEKPDQLAPVRREKRPEDKSRQEIEEEIQGLLDEIDSALREND